MVTGTRGSGHCCPLGTCVLLLEGQRLNSAELQGSGQGPAGFLPRATSTALTLRTVPEHRELLRSTVLKHKQRG